MSNKSAKKPKKLSIPRTLDEINRAYQQACANAGQTQYQIYFHSKELEKLNAQIETLNNEGAARMQLDREEAARKKAAETTTQQQATV